MMISNTKQEYILTFSSGTILKCWGSESGKSKSLLLKYQVWTNARHFTISQEISHCPRVKGETELAGEDWDGAVWCGREGCCSEPMNTGRRDTGMASPRYESLGVCGVVMCPGPGTHTPGSSASLRMWPSGWHLWQWLWWGQRLVDGADDGAGSGDGGCVVEAGKY